MQILNIATELLRAIVVAMLLLLLLYRGRKDGLNRVAGWHEILLGCSLVLFGYLLDLTDNFPELDKYLVIGDTPTEAFLEKIVGYLGGYLMLFIGFWRWIPMATKLRVISADLREQEARFKAMVETSSDWLWEVDANGRYTYASPRINDLLGFTPNEIIGRTPFDLMPLDEAERIRPIFGEFVAAGRAFYLLENINIHRDGRPVVLETSGVPLLDSAGNLIGYQGIDRDITERKQAELALRESESRFRAIFESSPDAVWIIMGRRFVEGNTAAAQIFGYPSPTDFINLHPTQISPPVQPDGQDSFSKAEQMMKMAEEQGICRFEWLHKRADDSVFDTEVTLAKFAINGQPALYAMVRDITERKRNQTELEFYRQSLELQVYERTAELSKAKRIAEAANLAKSAFMSNISHEMRTPMHQAKGLATLLRRDSLTPAQTKRLGQLDVVLNNLNNIIETVLQLTLIESGKLSLASKQIDIDSLIRMTIEPLRERIEKKQLRLVVDVPEVHTALIGDEAHLKTALLSYLDNAIRFTEAGTVSVRVRVLDENEQDAIVRFEVIDSGIGIAPEDQERIFSAFEQADNSFTRKFTGIGVGLALTRKIARIMGGDAGCESELGKGATFWFTSRLRKDASSLVDDL